MLPTRDLRQPASRASGPCPRQPAAQSGNRLARARRPRACVLLVVVVARHQRLGDPSVPSDDASRSSRTRPTATITKEEFDGALQQTAARAGRSRRCPAPDDPQYDAARATRRCRTCSLSRWVARRGRRSAGSRSPTARSTTSSRQIIDRAVRRPRGSSRSSSRSPASPQEEARRAGRAAADLATGSRRTCSADGRRDGPATARRSRTSTSENKEQFEQPETRDVRVDPRRGRRRRPSGRPRSSRTTPPRAGRRSAKKYSIDEATKDTGGLRAGGRRGPVRAGARRGRSSPPPRASSSARSRATPATT